MDFHCFFGANPDILYELLADDNTEEKDYWK